MELIFLGLGSVIGGSFFLASGIAVQMAGPSVVLGYLIGGLITYLVMVSLGHLALRYKERESFRGYLQEAMGPVGGFTVGWIMWFTNIMAMVAESIAMSIYTRVWFPRMSLWVLMIIYNLLAVVINLYGIKIVNKSEGVLTVIKTGALAAFVGVVAYYLLLPHGAAAGVGANNLVPFFPHGAGGFIHAVVICTFAYGIGAFAAATGDTRNPRRDIPIATKGMTAGQALLFTLPTLALLLAVPWTMVSAGSSPFVSVLDHLGIDLGGSLLNAVVLIASFSSLVASMFSAVIMLSSLAREKEAPAFLSRQWKNISVYALLSSAGALLLFSFLTQLLPKNIYNYAVTTTGYLSLINWGSILAARLVICLPAKNEGRVDRGGLTETILGLASILLISIFSLQAPEQTYSFVLTTVILLLTMGAGKLLVKKREAAGKKERGRVQYPFSDSKSGPSLLDAIKIMLKQK